jgi:DNA end-binding protein Ku
VIRTRQHLAVVSVRDKLLVLEVLRFAREIIPFSELEIPRDLLETRIDPEELKMAEQIIRGMTGAWQPEKYEDEYRKDVMALIEKKVESGKLGPVVARGRKRTEEKKAKIVDLMPLLRQSLERAKAGSSSRSGRPGRTAAAKRVVQIRSKPLSRGRALRRSG